MSKKIDAIKKQVFYAQQNPELLAKTIAGTVTDVATEVYVAGESILPVATTGTAKTSTYTATVLSQYGDDMTSGSSITYALKSAVTGVSINSSTGVLSVANTTTGTSATVTATAGGKTGERVVTLLVPTTVTVAGAESITIPASDSTTSTYTAEVKDQNGDKLTDATVTWSLKAEVSGVSVNSSTGVVTVASTANAESFILVATCNSATKETTVALASE